MMLQSDNAQAALEIGEPGGATAVPIGIHREAKRGALFPAWLPMESAAQARPEAAGDVVEEPVSR